MKIHIEANKLWTFAPNIIIRFDHFWCENSIITCFKVNFYAVISGFGAKIKIGEKVRFFEHCALVTFQLVYYLLNEANAAKEESSWVYPESQGNAAKQA